MSQTERVVSQVIKPTVGRVVYYFVREAKYDFGFSLQPGRPHAAIVTAVWGDTMVNLSVFDANGRQFGKTSVYLRQPGESEPTGYADWCEWMPFQVGQSQKTAELEKELAAAKAA